MRNKSYSGGGEEEERIEREKIIKDKANKELREWKLANPSPSPEQVAAAPIANEKPKSLESMRDAQRMQTITIEYDATSKERIGLDFEKEWPDGARVIKANGLSHIAPVGSMLTHINGTTLADHIKKLHEEGVISEVEASMKLDFKKFAKILKYVKKNAGKDNKFTFTFTDPIFENRSRLTGELQVLRLTQLRRAQEEAMAMIKNKKVAERRKMKVDEARGGTPDGERAVLVDILLVDAAVAAWVVLAPKGADGVKEEKGVKRNATDSFHDPIIMIEHLGQMTQSRHCIDDDDCIISNIPPGPGPKYCITATGECAKGGSREQDGGDKKRRKRKSNKKSKKLKKRKKRKKTKKRSSINTMKIKKY